MNLRILVIDDEIEYAQCLKESLKSKDNVVDIAVSAGEAFAMLEDKWYEVVITDIRMAGITGVTLLKAVKNRNPLCQVLCISGYGDEETIKACLKNGAVDFLEKPFPMKVLRTLVGEIGGRFSRWEEKGIGIESCQKK